ncbi:MAG: hypothetical protein U9N14_06075, partial [Pseudomonadota bacterium]|nr:hypothetical protein [Pseudomonadota bacterium]
TQNRMNNCLYFKGFLDNGDCHRAIIGYWLSTLAFRNMQKISMALYEQAYLYYRENLIDLGGDHVIQAFGMDKNLPTLGKSDKISWSNVYLGRLCQVYDSLTKEQKSAFDMLFVDMGEVFAGISQKRRKLFVGWYNEHAKESKAIRKAQADLTAVARTRHDLLDAERIIDWAGQIRKATAEDDDGALMRIFTDLSMLKDSLENPKASQVRRSPDLKPPSP